MQINRHVAMTVVLLTLAAASPALAESGSISDILKGKVKDAPESPAGSGTSIEDILKKTTGTDAETNGVPPSNNIKTQIDGGAKPSASPAAPASPPATNDLADCGQYANPDVAIHGCTGVIQSGQFQRSDLIRAYYNRGFAYWKKTYYDRAIADFSQFIQLGQNNVNAYFYRGFSYYETRDYDRAISDYNKVIESGEYHGVSLGVTYHNRGTAYHQKGDYDRAISDYNNAIQLNPDYAVAYYDRGNAFVGKGDYDRAIADYNKAIASGSYQGDALADTYDARGVAYDDKGDYDKAIADYSKAIATNPSYIEAYDNRGGAYDKKGDYNHAIADYTQVIALGKYQGNDLARVYSERGSAYDKAGEHDRAVADFDKAKRLGKTP